MDMITPHYLQDSVLAYRNGELDLWSDYISTKMDAFSAYDAQRPTGHPYPFDVHSKRVASLMKLFATHLGFSSEQADCLYWATLPHDIGKMALPVHIWDSEDKPTDEEKALRRTHVAEGLSMIRHDYSAEELDTPFMTLLLNIMENHHEALDGTGLFGKTAHELDMVARMACICDAFDGYSVTRPHFGDRDISINAVITRMSDEKSGHFDPKLLSLFAGMMEQHYNINQNFVDQIQK